MHHTSPAKLANFCVTAPAHTYQPITGSASFFFSTTNIIPHIVPLAHFSFHFSKRRSIQRRPSPALSPATDETKNAFCWCRRTNSFPILCLDSPKTYTPNRSSSPKQSRKGRRRKCCLFVQERFIVLYYNLQIVHWKG